MKRSAWLFLRLAAAAALIAYVASQVHLHDQVAIRDAEFGRTLMILQSPELHAAVRSGQEFQIQESPGGGLVLEEIGSGEPVDFRLPKGSWSSGSTVTLELEAGLLSILGSPEPIWIAVSLLCLAAGFLCAVWRWTLLLRAQSVTIGYADALRLSLIGLFFNHLVPSSVGGDVLKAVFVSKRTGDRKTAAVLSIFVDRLCGLAAVLLIGACSVLLAPVRYREVLVIVYALLLAGICGATLALSPRLQASLGLRALIERLPGQSILTKLEEAAEIYRSRKGLLAGALGLSALNHFGVIGAYLCAACALGWSPEVLTFLTSVPMIDLASALPVAPGGWGTGEAAAVHFFGLAAVAETMALATSVLFRLVALSMSLPGGLLLAFSTKSRDIARPALARS